jgi:hypothetical protein
MLGVRSVSSAKRKKQHALFLFERFAEAAKLTREVLDSENESPDLIVRVSGELVGIEITELFVSEDAQGGSLQARESIAQRIVTKAQRIYETSGPPYAHVSVLFATGYDLGSLNRDDTAESLAKFVRSIHLPEGRHVQWRQDFESNLLHEAISFLNMLAVPKREMAHWTAPSAGWVATIPTDLLQRKINEKASRLPMYLQRAPKNWLLLVGDGSHPSRFIRAGPDMNVEGVNSPFDRTFLFGLTSGLIVEL